ncbi:hypothetical protein RDWZM_001696 [Blomia tropicalis]|uniref:G-protein coupled receptors family 1 profile domain-containing protein n=1 Tax=Blomia tropicalis TaxID=40697 RepID=A0A9Q0RRJ2_BLOTA|nr:hypothetical protein RDWZM_001696 [Blomia tropicalis]
MPRIKSNHLPNNKLSHNLNPNITVTSTASTSKVTNQHHHGNSGSPTGSSQLRIYLINLFVNDILIALFTTPFTYTDFMYGQWIYPEFLCPVSNFISICAVSVSIYTLIAIGLERYFAIICPFKKLVPFERHTKWIIALIWFIGILLGSPALFKARALPFEFQNQSLLDCREMWEQEMGGKIYTGVIFFATFLVPFVALTYLYVSIAIKAFRHVIPGNADASRDQIQLRNKIRISEICDELGTIGRILFCCCTSNGGRHRRSPSNLMNSSLSISEVDGRRSSRASSVTSWFPTTNAAAAAGTTTTTTAGRNQLAMHSASFSGRSGFRVKSHQSSLKHHGQNLSPNHRATSTTVARHHSIAVCPPNPNCSIEERQTSTPTLTVDTINQMGNVECETINHERIMNVTKQQSQPQINL